MVFIYIFAILHPTVDADNFYASCNDPQHDADSFYASCNDDDSQSTSLLGACPDGEKVKGPYPGVLQLRVKQRREEDASDDDSPSTSPPGVFPGADDVKELYPDVVQLGGHYASHGIVGEPVIRTHTAILTPTRRIFSTIP